MGLGLGLGLELGLVRVRVRARVRLRVRVRLRARFHKPRVPEVELSALARLLQPRQPEPVVCEDALELGLAWLGMRLGLGLRLGPGLG